METYEYNLSNYSEGESLIEEYLIQNGYSYEYQVDILGLKGDTRRSKRRADFYLTKYDVYVEFLGEWNNPERREEYKYKKGVYYNNNKPCVYIYPDNLGSLEYLFPLRLKMELKKFKKHKELRKYLRRGFINKKLNNHVFYILMILSFWIYYVETDLFDSWHSFITVLLGFSLLPLLYNIVAIIYHFFSHKKTVKLYKKVMNK